MRNRSGSLPPLGGSIGAESGPSTVLLCFMLCTCVREDNWLDNFTFVWHVDQLNWVWTQLVEDTT